MVLQENYVRTPNMPASPTSEQMRALRFQDGLVSRLKRVVSLFRSSLLIDQKMNAIFHFSKIH